MATRLDKEGFEITQATLSRDLKLLKVAKADRKKRQRGQGCHPQLPGKGGEIYLAAFY